MNTNEKNQIVKELKVQVAQSSQKRVAARIGISTATVSHMINGKWELIRAEMWRRARVNLGLDLHWEVVDTDNLKTLNKTLRAVQGMSMSIAVSEMAGIGKSQAYKRYARTHKNVILVECKNYWTKKSYMRNLLAATGLEQTGTTEELIERLLHYMKGLDRPLMIIDQADKLKDPQLDLFMDFYNDLFGSCGFVLSGVKALEKRILRGVQRDKIGYSELWSRVGRKFYDQLQPVSIEDVQQICKANGVDDTDDHRHIFQVCDGDLRKVRREVEKRQLVMN